MKRLAVLASGRGSNLQAIIEAVRSGALTLEIVGWPQTGLKPKP